MGLKVISVAALSAVLAGCSPSVCEDQSMINMILAGASSINYDNVQGYSKIDGVEADVIDIDEVKSEPGRVVCSARFEASGDLTKLAYIFDKVGTDAGTDWLSEQGLAELNAMGTAFESVDELIKADAVAKERVEAEMKPKTLTASSAITYAVNPNEGSPAFIGWQHTSPDDNFLVSYSRAAAKMMNEAVANELKVQGYESLEQKRKIEGEVRGKSSQFDSLSQAITRDSDKVAELSKKQAELEKSLTALEQEKSTLEPKVKPVIDAAKSKVAVANNSEFTFDGLYWDSNKTFNSKDLILKGTVKNNTGKYVKGIKLEGWIMASGVDGPTKLAFNAYIFDSVAPGKTGKIYGRAVSSDSSFGHNLLVSAPIANSPRVGGWLRAVEYDTDTERNIRTTPVGEDVVRYLTIDADLSATTNQIREASTQLASLTESVEVAKRQQEALREELAVATKSLPKSSALYQKFAGAQVKAGL
jgi:prefoldin subunit 5